MAERGAIGRRAIGWRAIGWRLVKALLIMAPVVAASMVGRPVAADPPAAPSAAPSTEPAPTKTSAPPAASSSAAPPAPPAEPAPITIAYRPGVYGALPFFVASEKGWWAPAGLQPTMVTYPEAAPQMAALGEGAWDVGETGAVSAVLAGARGKLMAVGLADDESAAVGMIARASDADAILAKPLSLKGKNLLLTPVTSSEYAAIACLATWRLKRDDLQVTELDPAAIVKSFAAGEGVVAALEPPESYAAIDAGAKSICNANDIGITVPGTLVARKGFAKDHPELVARFVAVYLRAVAWEKAHRDETIDAMRRFSRQSHVTLSDLDLATDIDTRPNFLLSEQLKLLDREKGGVSTADGWYAKVAAYLVVAGTIQAPPLAETFLTDTYVKWVDGDPVLETYAEGP